MLEMQTYYNKFDQLLNVSKDMFLTRLFFHVYF